MAACLEYSSQHSRQNSITCGQLSIRSTKVLDRDSFIEGADVVQVHMLDARHLSKVPCHVFSATFP